MNDKLLRPPNIPEWMVWVQCICFSALYAIWALPETILIRNICLITGALLSLWTIYQYRYSFFHRRAIPVWLIVALFAWATFHLFFLSYDFAAQFEEYTSIWKRSAIGAIFGIGLGISVVQYFRVGHTKSFCMWGLLYAGLLMPSLIYDIKFLLSSYAQLWGLKIPEYWLLYSHSMPFFVPKTAYLCFCLPVLAIAFGQLLKNIERYRLLDPFNVIYLLTIPTVFFIFYTENIKNGVIYSIILLAIFCLGLIIINLRMYFLRKLLTIFILIFSASLFLSQHLNRNDSWITLLADAKVAMDTQVNQQWKYNGERGYPINEFGKKVIPTNYDRVAWGKVGLGLIAQNPLGYGLIERSFGRLAKIEWSDSKLHQSHSGWVDLTLGLGLPGLFLILACSLILLSTMSKIAYHSIMLNDPYPFVVAWVLLSLLLMWCTTEISQKVYFDHLIFCLSFGGGICLNHKNQPSQSD